MRSTECQLTCRDCSDHAVYEIAVTFGEGKNECMLVEGLQSCIACLCRTSLRLLKERLGLMEVLSFTYLDHRHEDEEPRPVGIEPARQR